MTPFVVFMALIGATMAAIAQICFKVYMGRGGNLVPRVMFGNKLVWLGIVLYWAFFAALIAAYSAGGDISVVFPVTAVGYLIVPVLGWFLLGERFGWRVPVGSIVIVAGCVLLLLGNQ